MSEQNGFHAGKYGPPWAQGERRAGVRHPSGRPIACHPTPGAAGADWWETGVVRDISGNGVGLALGRRLEPGSVVIVGRDGSRYLAARVIYAVRQETYWIAGCKLLTPLREAELRAWQEGDEE